MKSSLEERANGSLLIRLINKFGMPAFLDESGKSIDCNRVGALCRYDGRQNGSTRIDTCDQCGSLDLVLVITKKAVVSYQQGSGPLGGLGTVLSVRTPGGHAVRTPASVWHMIDSMLLNLFFGRLSGIRHDLRLLELLLDAMCIARL